MNDFYRYCFVGALVVSPFVSGCSAGSDDVESSGDDLTSRQYTCRLSAQFGDSGARYETIRGPQTLTGNSSLRWELLLRRSDGRSAPLRSDFRVRFVGNRPANAATILSPFDGTTWAHDDGAGTTTLSPSMGSLVDDILRSRPSTRDALATYHVVQLKNDTGFSFFLNGREVKAMSVGCQVGNQ